MIGSSVLRSKETPMAVLDLTTELLTQIRDNLAEVRADLESTRADLAKRIDHTHARLDQLHTRMDQTRTDLLDTLVDFRIELSDRIDLVRRDVGLLAGHVVTLADRVLKLEGA